MGVSDDRTSKLGEGTDKEFSQAEVALLLGCTRGAVQMAEARALRKMRAALEQDGFTEEEQF